MEDDSKYLNLLKLGSERAFDYFYEKYSKRMFAFCMKWTKSRSASEDIVQDTFVKLWTSHEKIKTEYPIMILLFNIARNKLIDRYRKTVDSICFEEFIQYSNEKYIDSNLPSGKIEYDELCEKINSFGKRLPRTQQQVFNYRIFQQKSNKEIAKLLSLSEQTIKNQFSLALKSLRKKLLL